MPNYYLEHGIIYSKQVKKKEVLEKVYMYLYLCTHTHSHIFDKTKYIIEWAEIKQKKF